MPRKAPRKKTKSKRPARGANARPGRSSSKGAGPIAGAILLGMGALLVKGLIYIMPTKEQIKTFWSKPWARKATYVTASLLVTLLLLSGMKNGLADDPSYQIDPAGVEISSGRLTWLNEEGSEALVARIQDDISADLANLGQRDAFDEELLAEVAERIQANPWVANVIRITRHFPSETEGARLSVEIDVRKPVLRAKVGNTLYFIDGQGVSMPLEMKVNDNWSAVSEENKAVLASMTPKLRYVSSVSGQRPTPGEVWENEQIKAALSMERTIRQHKIGAIVPIRQIDVSHINPRKDWRGEPVYNPNGGVLLIPKTSATTEIIWGKAEIHAGSFEPKVEEKLRLLKSYVSEDASLITMPEVRLNVAPRS